MRHSKGGSWELHKCYKGLFVEAEALSENCMEFILNVLAGVTVGAICGGVGYFVKSKWFSTETYLPVMPRANSTAYQFLCGEWHEYHFTYEPKIIEARWLAHAVIEFSLTRKSVVEGRGKFPTEHRRILHYRYRGQIYNGNLYYTAVCDDDPNDAYCALYRNVNDDQIFGAITGLDYAKQPFASPILLSKRELSREAAECLLERVEVKFFSGIHIEST